MHPQRFVRAILFACLTVVAFDMGRLFAADGAVQGVVRYEKILDRHPKTGVGGLQVNAPQTRPVVGARIELVDPDGKPLAEARTDENGAYRLPWSGDAGTLAIVRVWAEAANATVFDHNDRRRVYSVASEPFSLEGGDVQKDVTARDQDRGSGPFNILELVRLANRLLRSAETNVEFPKVSIFWTTRHREGTSYFIRGRNELYLLGDRSVDSDEFDDSVVLHEYGHFVMANLSKDNSMGGPHGSDRVDPRVAWSEGWASYFACAALDNPRYVDTGANRENGSSVLVEYQVDVLRANGERPGFGNERTVARVLWQLQMGKPGRPGVGFASLWNVLRGKDWASRNAYRTLLEYCDAYIAANPDSETMVRDVLKSNGIASEAKSVLADQYVRPLRLEATAEGQADSFGGVGPNNQDATAVYRLRVEKQSKTTIRLNILASERRNADLDLYLCDAEGRILGHSTEINGVGGTETISRTLEPGVYFVEVHSYNRSRPNGARFRLTATTGEPAEQAVDVRDLEIRHVTESR